MSAKKSRQSGHHAFSLEEQQSLVKNIVIPAKAGTTINYKVPRNPDGLYK